LIVSRIAKNKQSDDDPRDCRDSISSEGGKSCGTPDEQNREQVDESATMEILRALGHNEYCRQDEQVEDQAQDVSRNQ
jgi:hypothetical protein